MKIFRFKRKLDSKGIFVDEWVNLELIAGIKTEGATLRLLITGTNDNANTRYVMVTEREDVEALISILNNEHAMLLNEQEVFNKINAIGSGKVDIEAELEETYKENMEKKGDVLDVLNQKTIDTLEVEQETKDEQTKEEVVEKQETKPKGNKKKKADIEELISEESL